jgi:hypothetical protein
MVNMAIPSVPRPARRGHAGGIIKHEKNPSLWGIGMDSPGGPRRLAKTAYNEVLH